eukprot:2053447-Rhodomonas_salina.1
MGMGMGGSVVEMESLLQGCGVCATLGPATLEGTNAHCFALRDCARTGVEILLRTFFPRNSFLYYASKNFPPQVHAPANPQPNP